MAFAAAGAAHVALLGRNSDSLKQTASVLPSSVSSSSHVVDVTQEDALAQVAKAIGKWDVLVLGAGYVSSPSTIAASDFKEFWQSFEVILPWRFSSYNSHCSILTAFFASCPLN